MIYVLVYGYGRFLYSVFPRTSLLEKYFITIESILGILKYSINIQGTID
jgi:hypothetical protein